MAADGVPDRAVRAVYSLWGFPGHDRAVCGEYPGGRAVYPAGVGDIGGREEQCGIAGLTRGWVGFDARDVWMSRMLVGRLMITSILDCMILRLRYN